MTATTSATYTAWSWLTDLLAGQTWPAPPVGSDAVEVWFGDPQLPPPHIAAALERVVVVGTVRTPGQEWGPAGNMAREEQFRVPIYVETALPFDALVSTSARQAAARLEALTSTIELAVRAVNAARRAGPPPSEFARYPRWEVAVAEVVPMTPPGDAGSVGAAEVVVEFLFRVGTPPVA